MKKKFTLLFLVVLLAAVGVNAKSRTTTLWEGTDTGANIEVAKSELVKGATLNLTFNWLGSEGAQFSCFWWNSSTSAWVKIKDWQWVNNGESYSFTLTDDEFDAITNDKLCFKTEVPAKMTFAKITQTETFTPTSVSDNLLDANWASSKETPKKLSAINSVKMGDVLRFTVSTVDQWTWVQFKLTDKNGNVDQFTGSGSELSGNGDGLTTFTFEFTISTLNDLWIIMNSGFGVIQTGDNAFTLTAVNLLSYADSYDYTIDIEMGSDGYMTYSNSVNLDFSGTGLTPYYASGATSGTVTLTSATTTWNWQGYILKGSPGTHSPKVVADAYASYPSGNLLKQNVDESTIKASESGDTNFRYIFAKDNTTGEIGFYKLEADHTLAANKAYLETSEDYTPPALLMGARGLIRLSFGGGEGTTAINTALKNPIVEDGLYYTLQGVAVKNPSKGIYILNGKKVFVK